MGRLHRIVFLACTASLLVGPAHLRRPFAAETVEVSSTPGTQAVDANSIRPPAAIQVAPYQLEQGTVEPEPQGLKDYMDANEQISVFGIDMRAWKDHHPLRRSSRPSTWHRTA